MSYLFDGTAEKSQPLKHVVPLTMCRKVKKLKTPIYIYDGEQKRLFPIMLSECLTGTVHAV